MIHSKEALIIFVRKPERGKVKTRLAAAIGEGAALAVYEQLLQHTHAVCSSLTCDKYVFYVNAVEEVDRWSQGYHKLIQANTDLGGRMRTAFALLFQKGYHRICIIGSDCFELTVTVINHAFSLLQSNDVVIGPAKDGGYYLLGMQGDLKEVFDAIEWSTEKVLDQTKRKAVQRGYSYALLPVLTDVDTVDDVPQEILSSLQQGEAGAEKIF